MSGIANPIELSAPVPKENEMDLLSDSRARAVISPLALVFTRPAMPRPAFHPYTC
jgi:hypothetical protein